MVRSEYIEEALVQEYSESAANEGGQEGWRRTSVECALVFNLMLAMVFNLMLPLVFGLMPSC